MLKWEEVKQNTAGILERTKVFGGWLVREVQEVHLELGSDSRDILSNSGYEWTTSITFVPDSHWQWNLEEEDGNS